MSRLLKERDGLHGCQDYLQRTEFLSDYAQQWDCLNAQNDLVETEYQQVVQFIHRQNNEIQD